MEGQLLADVRSSLFGVVVGAVAAWTTAVVAAPDRINAYIYPNDDGFAKPFDSLVPDIEAEGDTVRIEFQPKALRDLWVCEYAYLSGLSARENLMSYIDKYAMCLSINEANEGTFVIRPNARGGVIKEANGQFFCNCPGVQ
jgi:hypothetical protein